MDRNGAIPQTVDHFIVVDLDAKSGNPRHFRTHPDEDRAVSEAKRLADENPGHRFCVYNSIAIVVKQAPVQVIFFEKEPPF